MLGLRHAGTRRGDALPLAEAARQVTAEEHRSFGHNLHAYLLARQHITACWEADCKHFLTVQACTGTAPPDAVDVLPAAHQFLQEHGAINFGVLPDIPPALFGPTSGATTATAPVQQLQRRESSMDVLARAVALQPETLAAEAEGAAAAAAAAAKSVRVGPSNHELLTRLYEFLRTADFEAITEKRIRKALALEFGVDLEDRKLMLRRHIEHVINHLGDAEPADPLDFEPDKVEDRAHPAPLPHLPSPARAADVSPPAAATAAAHSVAIVGAGLSGLTAATLLKINGVQATVIDASEAPAGGAAGTALADTRLLFSCATPDDTAKEETMPSVLGATLGGAAGALVQQLGLQLRPVDLQHVLVLDGKTGQQLDSETDAAAERLRDEVLGGLVAKLRGGGGAGVPRDCAAALATMIQAYAGSTAGLAEAGEGVPAGDVEGAPAQGTAEVPEGGTAPLQDSQQREAVPTHGSTVGPNEDVLSALMWHWQYLEHAAGGLLSELSTVYACQLAGDQAASRRAAYIAIGREGAGVGAALEVGLARQLDVRHGVRVTSIQHSHHGVKLTAASGEVIECSALVLAVPLGALRDIVFDPPLPAWKQQAIAAAGWAPELQVTLRLPTAPPVLATAIANGVFGTVPSLPARGGGEGTLPLQAGQPSVFHSLPPPEEGRAQAPGARVIAHFPGVAAADLRVREDLTARVKVPVARACQHAMLQHQQPRRHLRAGSEASSADWIEASLQAAALEALRPFLNLGEGEEVTATVEQDFTRWHSFPAAGAPADSACDSDVGSTGLGVQADLLARPIKRRLLFAGPHTVVVWPPGAQLQAALASGLREGARALKLLRSDEAIEVGDEPALGKSQLKATVAHSGGGEEAKDVKKATKKAEKEAAKRAGKDAKKAAKKAEKARRKGKEASDDNDDKDARPTKRTKCRKSEEAEDADEDEAMDSESGGEQDIAGDTPACGRKGRIAAGKARGKRKRADGGDDDDGSDRGIAKEEEPRHLPVRDRQDMKVFWQAAMQAEQGDLGPFLAILANATDLDSRQQALKVLLGSTARLTDRLAANAEVLPMLNTWLADLCSTASEENLLLELLGLLRRMPIKPEPLKASGLLAAVRQRATANRSREVKTAAVAVLHAWTPVRMPAAASAVIAASVAAAAAATPGTVPKALQPAPPAAMAAPLTGAAAERAAAIAETEARLQAAREEAEALVAARSAAAAAAPISAHAPERISSFSEFRKQGGSAASHGGGSGNPSNRSSQAAAAALANLSVELRNALKEATKAAIRPHFKRGAVNEQQYRSIYDKVMVKVGSNFADKADGKELVSQRRKEKINQLVEAYVKQLKGR